MRTVVVRNGARIPLGKQGENNAVRVVWPGIAEKYAKLYGDGRFELVVVQNGKVYPAVVNVDGADLIWNVLAADVAIAEIGSLELIYYVGDTIAKSQTWETFVEVSKSAEGTTEPPEPAKNWVDVVINTASNAKQSATESAESARQSAESATNAAASATKAENAVGHSPIVGENGNWFVWDFEKSEYVDSDKPSTTPPITPDTAGKYLINDGNKAEWGEVNGTLRVNLNKNSNDEWIIDKTFGEIEKAINDGQVVYVVDMFNKPTISGARGYRTFYYDSYSSPRFGGDFYMFVSSSYGEIRFLNIYFNQVFVHDIGVNAVLGEEVSSNDVLKLGDRGINAAIPNVDYALPTLYVTITPDGQDSDGNPIYKSNKTYTEIKAAHEAGREVKIARAGMFDVEIFFRLGLVDIPLLTIGNDETPMGEVAIFGSIGTPFPDLQKVTETGGQCITILSILVQADGQVHVNSSIDFATGKWVPFAINKLPQQYIINVIEGTDGTMAADWTYDEIQETLGAYQTDKGGTAVFGVAFEGCLYRMVAGDNKSVVFSDTTPEGISTLTLSQKDGKDVWTHEVVPLSVDNSFRVTLTSKVSGGYDIDKTLNEVVKAYNDNKYIYALFQNKNDFEFLSLDKFLVPGVEGYSLIAFSNEHRCIVFHSSGGSALMYDKSRSSDMTVLRRGDAMPPVPVTAADNGKFLRVVNGQWAAEAVANAKGVSF